MNSTVTENVQRQSTDPGQQSPGGGGFFSESASTLDLLSCTVSGNHARAAGGAFHVRDSASLTVLQDTVVRENTAGENGVDSI